MTYGIYEEQCLLQERERKNQYDRIPDMLKGLFGKTGDNVFVESPLRLEIMFGLVAAW